MYFDLNLEISDSKNSYELENLVTSCLEEGYAGIAINYKFSGNIKDIKISINQKFNIDKLIENAKKRVKLEKEDVFYKNFMQLSRITLKIDIPSALDHLKEENESLKQFDIIAVQTNNERVFSKICLEVAMVDIIAFDFSQKLFKMKHNLIEEAHKRGIFFEILYADSIKDTDDRKMILSNLVQQVRLSRGKNLIQNSGATKSLYHRSPPDLMCFGSLIELKPDEIFKAISENMSLCIKKASLRNSFKGAISLATDEEVEQLHEVVKKIKAK